jgi:poly(3-hydroxyalkanoate) depolymerase
MIEHVTVSGTRLRISIQGTGRPLLLFNGIGASLELLQPFRAALRATETIAVDMPGSGGSAMTALPLRFPGLADLADALLGVLGYERVDVLGVSWGGGLAQEFARRHPRRVRCLVLAATSTGVVSVPGEPAALWVLCTPRRYSSPAYFESVAPVLYGGAFRENPRLLRQQGHLRFIHPPSLRGYLWQLAAGWGWTSVFWLHKVRSPTLVLAADDDPIIPLVNARVLARALPHARLRVIPGGGHLFLITHATEVAPIIEDFLSTEPPPRASP